ncbi:MAG: hypothetical protein ABIZ07_09580 [Dermatophilaceae bacterium]
MGRYWEIGPRSPSMLPRPSGGRGQRGRHPRAARGRHRGGVARGA